MCLAIPGKVLRLVDEQKGIASVEVTGIPREVNLGLLPPEERPAVGDYVLVHVGYALARVDEEEALETLRTLEELTGGFDQDSAAEPGPVEVGGVR